MPIAFSPRANLVFTLLVYNGVCLQRRGLQRRGPTLGAKNLRRAVPRDRRIPRRHAQFKRN